MIGRSVPAWVLVVVALAGCAGDSHASGKSPVAASAAPSARLGTSKPQVSSPSETPAPSAPATPVVNGRITSIQSHLRSRVSSYNWLAFDRASDQGLFFRGGWCHACRPREIHTRLTVASRTGPVATLFCPHVPTCRARRFGSIATLGPASDEITVESGDRILKVVGYDGTVRRTLDLTATVPRGRDIWWLAWSPAGDRLAIQANRGGERSNLWLVEGAVTARLVYSRSNPSYGRPVAWSPDGQSLLFDRLIPDGKGGIRVHGADVVVLHWPSDGSPRAITTEALYRSNRHFDWAGNAAWSPDGTRIAVRVRNGIVEISAADGRVLARHPQTRRTSGWLVWLRKDT